MNYKLDHIADKKNEILLRIYISYAEYMLQLADPDEDIDLKYRKVQQNYIDPVLLIEEEKNNIAIALKVKQMNVGEKREDGTVEIALFCSYNKFDIDDPRIAGNE